MTDPGFSFSPDIPHVPKRGVGAAILHELAWIIASIVVLVLLTGMLSIVMEQSSAMVPFTALLMLFAVSMIVRAIRRRQAMLAINYIEQAVRQNLPIPTMLGAAEQTESGALQWRLSRLRAEIERGATVSAALAATLRGVPPRTLGLISSGERLGRLAQVLARLVQRQPRSPDDRDPAHMIYLRWYPLAMAAGLTVCSMVISAFVIPRYQSIFSDFGLPLPPLTAWVFNAFQNVSPPFLVIVAIVFAIVCGRTVAGVFPPAGPPFDIWKWLTDRLAWVTPVWRGITRNRGLADVCHIVADALEVGQPLDRALFEAAEASPNVVLRRRIERWAQHVTSGMPVSDAARTARLPPLVPNLLRTAHGPDGARDVFRFLARFYDSRHSAAAGVIQGAAIPLMVGVFGAAVAALALAMFLPLVRLMQQLPVHGRLL
jgi:type II secretory pathway component PulF